MIRDREAGERWTRTFRSSVEGRCVSLVSVCWGRRRESNEVAEGRVCMSVCVCVCVVDVWEEMGERARAAQQRAVLLPLIHPTPSTCSRLQNQTPSTPHHPPNPPTHHLHLRTNHHGPSVPSKRCSLRGARRAKVHPSCRPTSVPRPRLRRRATAGQRQATMPTMTARPARAGSCVGR